MLELMQIKTEIEFKAKKNDMNLPCNQVKRTVKTSKKEISKLVVNSGPGKIKTSLTRKSAPHDIEYYKSFSIP